MAFNCPQCQTNSLVITHALELPPDGRSDEITLQLVACHACGFVGTAVYEESRRGASESWHHDGYLVSQADYAQLKKLIEQCPLPKDTHCLCQSHQLLNRVNKNGYWHRPFTPQGLFFLMKLQS